MPSKHRCFMIEPTEEVVVTLRRFSFKTKCSRRLPRYPGGDVVLFEVHDVEVEVSVEVGTLEACIDGDMTQRTIARDDPRWPTTCGCGYVFVEADEKQECHIRLYRRTDTGELTTLRNAPVGALYDSGTLSDVDGYQRNGAGMSLVLKTPAGEWTIDGPASNGPGWTRTGTPPDLVVTPSIGIGSPQRMHGWLGGFNGKGDEPGWLCIDSP